MKSLSIRVALAAVLSLSLLCVATRALAAERPTNPAQLLLWLLSMNTSREQPERQKIDVNSATAEVLTAVPGLDRRQALRIIAHRPYATLQDLARAGLSTRGIERLTGLLTVAHHASGPSSAASPRTERAVAR